MTPQILFFIADTAPLSDPAVFDNALSLLPPDRQEKTGKYRFRKDKELSLGAGLLLRKACGDLGIPGADRKIVTGEFGKPAFADFPEVCFNLSHAGTKVLLSIGTVMNGCDVEMHQDRILKYSERLMTPPEYEDYMREAEEERKAHFFRLWTGKESLMKCTGKGFSQPVRSFTLRVDAEGIRLQEPIDGSDYRFFEYFGEKDYAITLCLRGYEGEAPELKKVILQGEEYYG